MNYLTLPIVLQKARGIQGKTYFCFQERFSEMQSQAICYFFVDPTGLPLPLGNAPFAKAHRL